MSKQYRLKEAKLYREARNEVLKSDDPEIWIARSGMEESLGKLMHDISNYIYFSLHMDDNPLRHLRRTFPDFVWRFYEGEDEQDAARILATADYIWMRLFGNLQDGFIIATQVGRKKPRVLCYWPEDEEAYLAVQIRMLVPLVRFVVDGDDIVADTIIK